VLGAGSDASRHIIEKRPDPVIGKERVSAVA
jgi:hypothetical protein